MSPALDAQKVAIITGASGAASLVVPGWSNLPDFKVRELPERAQCRWFQEEVRRAA